MPPTRRPHAADGTDPITRPAWAEYLSTLRTRHGLNASEAAARMGITPQTYAGIEAGTRVRNGQRVPVSPKDDTLHRVAQALDLTPAERRHLFALVTTGKTCHQPWQTRLKFARVAASISQAEAAQAAGVMVATYREWERKNSGVPRHECLRRLLDHLGWTPDQVAEFMDTVPADTAPARAPRQPTNPVHDLPAWSRFITQKRLDAGLYLSAVDQRLGQQSIIRRYELGGWPRSDGRLSVPSHDWLDRIAEALEMTPGDRAHLHLLADHQRLAVAAQSHRPLLAELFHEARKAVDVTRAEANTRVGFTTGTWSRLELGHPETLACLTPTAIEIAIAQLPIRSLLAAALRAAVPNGSEPADNTSSIHAPDTSAPAHA